MYVLFWLLALIPLSLGAVIQDRDDSQPLEEVYIPESGEMAIDIPPFGNGTATGDDPEVSKYGELVEIYLNNGLQGPWTFIPGWGYLRQAKDAICFNINHNFPQVRSIKVKRVTNDDTHCVFSEGSNCDKASVIVRAPAEWKKLYIVGWQDRMHSVKCSYTEGSGW